MHKTTNVDSWLETYKDSFKPPICAKLLYGFDWPDTNERGYLKVMYMLMNSSLPYKKGLLVPQTKGRTTTLKKEKYGPSEICTVFDF
jgi:hypothetical protein